MSDARRYVYDITKDELLAKIMSAYMVNSILSPFTKISECVKAIHNTGSSVFPVYSCPNNAFEVCIEDIYEIGWFDNHELYKNQIKLYIWINYRARYANREF